MSDPGDRRRFPWRIFLVVVIIHVAISFVTIVLGVHHHPSAAQASVEHVFSRILWFADDLIAPLIGLWHPSVGSLPAVIVLIGVTEMFAAAIWGVIVAGVVLAVRARPHSTPREDLTKRSS